MTLEQMAVIQHGTVEGYRAGCRGSATSCGAEVSCATVHMRYQGDWGFRKRVDAGEDAAAIVIAERAEADAVRARDKAAARVHHRAGAKVAQVREKRQRAAKVREAPVREGKTELLREQIKALHAEGLIDSAIAERLGEQLGTITYIRKDRLDLPRNYKPKKPRPVSARELRHQTIRDMHASGATDDEIADKLGSKRTIVQQTRHRMGLLANRLPAPDHNPEITRLHGEGKTDTEIADALGIGRAHAQRLRQRLELPSVQGHRSKWDGVELSACGTNASYARGCRCEECTDAHREYHREYTKRRRIEGADGYHGTAYGYQLGCRGGSCPQTPSCTTAMLDADRARRRAAGIPAKELVDATPVRAHVMDLRAAGMTVDQVAEKASVPRATIKALLFSRGVGRPPVETLLAERAVAVLAVPIPEEKAA